MTASQFLTQLEGLKGSILDVTTASYKCGGMWKKVVPDWDTTPPSQHMEELTETLASLKTELDRAQNRTQLLLDWANSRKL